MISSFKKFVYYLTISLKLCRLFFDEKARNISIKLLIIVPALVKIKVNKRLSKRRKTND
ncbi:hypothetical protein HMPREF3187_01634 [Aerococcus christensenii]|uniref:Uncharacterized protein n=1 Tax=Aerococcus christensenii TaxID=87541 RepID=A0A133XS28_9LACT|nr:hypothetical protein HMPREF3187_01634 [Aerococcus christensenii]